MNCWDCQYCQDLPGNAHKKCTHPVNTKIVSDPMIGILSVLGSVRRESFPLITNDAHKKLGIKLNPVGVNGGWGNWPMNFDPVWVDACKGFKALKKEKKHDVRQVVPRPVRKASVKKVHRKAGPDSGQP